MNFLVAIINVKSGNRMSVPKTSSPKMINALKDKVILYSKMFKEEYKVARFIETGRNKYKKI